MWPTARCAPNCAQSSRSYDRRTDPTGSVTWSGRVRSDDTTALKRRSLWISGYHAWLQRMWSRDRIQRLLVVRWSRKTTTVLQSLWHWRTALGLTQPQTVLHYITTDIHHLIIASIGPIFLSKLNPHVGYREISTENSENSKLIQIRIRTSIHVFICGGQTNARKRPTRK